MLRTDLPVNPLMPRPATRGASRRDFLKGAATVTGAFVLATFVPLGRGPLAQEAAASGPPAGIFEPNVFLKIAPDSTVTVLIKHFEMGQGITTGLSTLVAEELDADWGQMRYEMAPANPALYANLFFGTYMGTGGSTSTANSWTQMRKVGAAAREMLVAAAAKAWNVPAGEITVAKGTLAHPSGKTATFGDLAGAAMAEAVPADPALKTPDQWTLIGTRLPRLDSHDKTNGTAVYGLDIRRPGMLVAVIRRPDRFGGTVKSFDATAAKAVAGVVDVVQIPTGVAVIAKDTWSAMKGREALTVEWDDAKAETRSTDAIFASYREELKKTGLPADTRGDAAAGIAGAAKTTTAEFTFPYLAHAPMEPMNGVIQLTDEGAEIWSGSQFPSIDLYVTSAVLGIKPEQVKINILISGGSFGRRAVPNADWTFELAAVAKAFGRRDPIQLVWTREDDIKGGYYRPMFLHAVEAGVTADGKIAGWRHKVIGKSIFLGTAMEQMVVHDGVDDTSVEGVKDSPYKIPHFAVEAYNPTSEVPVLWWRSVGNTHTAQVMETMMDELATMAGRDAVEFRLELLAEHPRMADVLKLAAEKGDWGKPMPAGKGRGIAVHESFGTRVAMVAEVTVDGADIKVDRIVAAVDCGIAVNPDIIAAQVEGSVGFALSSVLRNAITLTDGVVDQSNFDGFEPTRMSEMPKVEVHIAKVDAPPSGIGEPAVPLLAPAIGNAVFQATGKRLRSLPLDLGTVG